LSMGTCVDGRIQCTYHGMQFDGTGRCVHIPGQARIPPTAQTRNFPLFERYGLVWLWMGNPTLADPARVPTVEKHGEAGWGLIDGGYQYHPSNYLNIVENLMDPAHTTFVHAKTIGNPLASHEPVKMEKTEQYVLSYKWIENTQPSPYDRRMREWGDQMIDRGQYFYLYPPAVSRVDIISIPTGLAHTEENMGKGMRGYSYKFLTPETESATHFFWLHLRNYFLGEEQSAQLRETLDKTFLEDREIEVAMQRSQQETGVRQFTGLEIDRGPTVALRIIQRMVESENEGATA
jgi:phenylpropionate dioxygenase-like ring-hydroxylating dioxygenase large terminal subunit